MGVSDQCQRGEEKEEEGGSWRIHQVRGGRCLQGNLAGLSVGDVLDSYDEEMERDNRSGWTKESTSSSPATRTYTKTIFEIIGPGLWVGLSKGHTIASPCDIFFLHVKMWHHPNTFR